MAYEQLPTPIALHLRSLQYRRESRPVWHDEKTATWHVYRYSDVARVLTDARTFGAAGSSSASYLEFSTFSQLPLPVAQRHSIDHNLDLVRPFLSEALTPRAVSRMQPYVERTVSELLGPLLSVGRSGAGAEVVSDLARPLASSVLGELVRRLLPIEVEGKLLSEDEVGASCDYFTTAAWATLSDMLGNALLLLSLRPDVVERLRREPPPVYSTVEETLRYLPPVWSTRRTVLTPMALHGQVLPEGAHICAWLVSANHDPEQFADPERFDIDRIPNRHLSFADNGTFSCLGGGLARLVTRLTLMAIARRTSRFELAPGNAVEVTSSFEPGDCAGSPGDADSLELEEQEPAGNRMPDRCSLQKLAVVFEATD
jgi:cytochrome P450